MIDYRSLILCALSVAQGGYTAILHKLRACLYEASHRDSSLRYTPLTFCDHSQWKIVEF